MAKATKNSSNQFPQAQTMPSQPCGPSIVTCADILSSGDIGTITDSRIIESSKTIVEQNIDAYFIDMDSLNILRADVYPRCTEYVDQMVSLSEYILRGAPQMPNPINDSVSASCNQEYLNDINKSSISTDSSLETFKKK